MKCGVSCGVSVLRHHMGGNRGDDGGDDLWCLLCFLCTGRPQGDNRGMMGEMTHGVSCGVSILGNNTR